MANLFGSNHTEIGSLSENLILNTAGKIKIRYGSKFIDLLDNQGNINSSNKTITSVNSEDSMSSDGFYLLNGNLYYKVNSNKGILVTSESGLSVSFDAEQTVSEEQINTAQKNIGLSFKTDDEATSIITNGIVIVDGQLKVIKEGEIANYLNDTLKEINELDNYELDETLPVAIVKQDNTWQYMTIPSYEEVKIYPVTWKYTTTDSKEATIITYVSSGTSASIPAEILKNSTALSNCDYNGYPITQATTISCIS